MNAIRSASLNLVTLLAPIILLVFWIRDLSKGHLW